MPGPVVFLDANALWADRALRRGDTRRLLSMCRRGLIELAIAEVVLRELERQHRNEVRGHLERLRQMPIKAEESRLLLGSAAQDFYVSQIAVDLDVVMAEYRQGVRERLREATAEVLPLPTVSHDQVLVRDLRQRPPFDAGGRGYRDTLHWHSILDRLRLDETQEAFLVSHDSDFGKSELHPELRAELPNDPTQLTLVESISALLLQSTMTVAEAALRREVLNPPDPEPGEIYPEAELWSTRVAEAGATGATESMDGTYIFPSGEALERLQIPREIYDVQIASASATGGFVWSPYEETDGTLLGQASIDAEIEFHGYVDKSDARILENDDLSIAEWDGDTALVEFERDARVNFDVRLELHGQTMDDIRFAGLEGP